MNINRVTTRFLAVLFLLLSLSSCASSVPETLAPAMVLHNGEIVTVDESFSIAQAVAIKDGRLIAVGSDSDVLALTGAGTEVMDLEGKTVLPGLHDSHLHLAWPVGEAPNPAIPELAAARSIGEIVEIVGREAEAASRIKSSSSSRIFSNSAMIARGRSR